MFLSYISSVPDTKKRQLEQKTIWHFKCKCSLCRDVDFDKQKHSLKCNGCGKIQPIDLESWQIYKLDLNCNDEKLSNLCKCKALDDMHSMEQDVRMYKYLWIKVTKIKSDNKVLEVGLDMFWDVYRN